MIAAVLDRAGLDPDLRDRWRPQRDRRRRAPRRGRPVRVRGRRERRLVPPRGAVDGGHHEHRGRPRRVLPGRARRDRGGVRASSRARATASWPAATTRPSGSVLERAGTSSVTYGTDAGRDLRLEVDVARARGRPRDGAHGEADAGRARAAGRRRPQPVERDGGARRRRRGGRRPSRTPPRRLATFAGVHRRFELRGEARGARLLRRLRTRADRDGRHDRRRRGASARAG